MYLNLVTRCPPAAHEAKERMLQKLYERMSLPSRVLSSTMESQLMQEAGPRVSLEP